MEYRFVNHSLFAENGIRDLKNSGALGKIIIYPFGEEGKIVKATLNQYFGVQEYVIVDNLLCEKYSGIKSLADLSDEDIKDAKVIICSDRPDIWEELREALYKRVPKLQCVEIFPHPATNLGILPRFPEFGIAAYLMEDALRQTAEFVSSNVPMARAFSCRRDMWEHIMLEEVEIEGLFMEFGVFGGSSINYLSTMKPGHVIYGFDSFEGLPEDWGIGAGILWVKKSLTNRDGKMPEVNSNVRLVKGWFDETLPSFLEHHTENCAFIHIDCDIYSSTKTVLSSLQERIVSGTVILFDEFFNYPNWQKHEYKAFQEFINDTGKKYEYIGYNDNGYQMAIKII